MHSRLGLGQACSAEELAQGAVLGSYGILWSERRSVRLICMSAMPCRIEGNVHHVAWYAHQEVTQ
jgi:hypothetical protein